MVIYWLYLSILIYIYIYALPSILQGMKMPRTWKWDVASKMCTQQTWECLEKVFSVSENFETMIKSLKVLLVIHRIKNTSRNYQDSVFGPKGNVALFWWYSQMKATLCSCFKICQRAATMSMIENHIYDGNHLKSLYSFLFS